MIDLGSKIKFGSRADILPTKMQDVTDNWRRQSIAKWVGVDCDWVPLYLCGEMRQSLLSAVDGREDDERIGEWLAILDESEERFRKRALHALRRLKDRGLYSSSEYGLLNVMKGCDPWLKSIICRLMRAESPENTIASLSELTEENWIAAIDLTMAMEEPELYRNMEAMYTPSIYDHTCVLALVLFYFTQRKQVLDIPKMVKHVNDYDDVTAQNEAMTDALEKKQSVNTQLRGIIADLRSDLSEQQRGWDKERQSLLRRIRELESGEAEPEAEPVSEAEQDAGAEPVITPEPEELEELPEKDVVFIGGDRNLLNKLQALFPDWTFSEPNDRHHNVQTGAKAVFYYVKTLDHSTYQLTQGCYKDVPQFFPTKTNIGLLLQEMTELWNKRAKNVSSTGQSEDK